MGTRGKLLSVSTKMGKRMGDAGQFDTPCTRSKDTKRNYYQGHTPLATLHASGILDRRPDSKAKWKAQSSSSSKAR
ncbi:hypothetical protein Ancab_031710 [Ancistrocladus abbreviatus]